MGEGWAPGRADPFARLEALSHRWDAHVLVQLAAGTPSVRRSTLARLITQAAGEHIADAQLDRSLHRLVAVGLVRFEVAGRRKLYQLTPPGRAQAALLLQVVDLLGSPPFDGQNHIRHDAVATDPPAGIFRATRHTARRTKLDHTQFAREWCTALSATAPVQLTRHECQRVLTALVERIHTALTAERWDPDAGRTIGGDLVAAGFTNPAALGRTITMIGTQLAPPAAEAATRTTRLVEEIAVGFTQAIRTSTLNAQEELQRATIRASRHRHNHTLRASTLDAESHSARG